MKEIEEQNKETAKFVKEYCVPVLKEIKSMLKDGSLSVEVWHYEVHGVTTYSHDGKEMKMQYPITDCRDNLHFLIDGNTVFGSHNCKYDAWQFFEMLQSFKEGMKYAR